MIYGKGYGDARRKAENFNERRQVKGASQGQGKNELVRAPPLEKRAVRRSEMV